MTYARSDEVVKIDFFVSSIFVVLKFGIANNLELITENYSIEFSVISSHLSVIPNTVLSMSRRRRHYFFGCRFVSCKFAGNTAFVEHDDAV